jgi:hypothetical protein
LLSAQDANGKASPSDSLKDLFAQIDTNGDGKITKAEFEDKLGAGGTNIAAADNVFNKMDADNDGSVSLDEMATALKPEWWSSPRASWRWRGCVDAGSAGRIKLLDHEQRRINHDHADVCGRLEGHDQSAGIIEYIDRRIDAVQSGREDGAAPGGCTCSDCEAVGFGEGVTAFLNTACVGSITHKLPIFITR